jgi:regulator of sigma E protease
LDNQESLRPDKLTTADAAEQSLDAVPDENLTVGQWLRRNGPMLVMLAAAIVLIQFFFKLDADSWWSIGKAALGLGLVIFIHELGHFLVAKWCDVHVQTFSIGFGPALPGCSFQWGETRYKLAVFPLGGYVQMVGQVDMHEESDGSEDDPRSYRNKSVWQRMAIISAGVTMNVILAVICFIIVFRGPGKDRKPAIVSGVLAGSPAYVQGLPTGAVITKIGDVEHPYFEDLMAVVMATQDGQHIPVTYQVGDKPPVTVEIEPKLNLSGGPRRPMIGISPPPSLRFRDKRYSPPDLQHPAMPHSAASEAKQPFEFGDTIVATTDPDQGAGYNPAKVTELPPDPRNPGSGLCDYFEFSRRMERLAGKEVRIRVQRGPEGKQQTLDIHVPPEFHYPVGVRMQMGQVTAVRRGSPGERAGVQPRDKNRSLNGDIIEKVELPEPDGNKTTFNSDTSKDGKHDAKLDPMRLPFELEQWARRWEQYAKEHEKVDKSKMMVTLHVQRHSASRGPETTQEVLHLPWDAAWRFDHEDTTSREAPLAIPELGIAYQVKTTVLDTQPTAENSGAGPFKANDVIKAVRFKYYTGKQDPEDSTTEEKWVELSPDQFAWIGANVNAMVKQITFKVERDKEIHEFTIDARPDKTWPTAERGFVLSEDLRRQRADSMLGAVELGLKDTKNTVVQVFQNLRGIFTGRISAENLGGPVTIARFAFQIAGVDFWEFVFFIGLISVNLAVINFLPIPVLDGGHMMFLLYEKIRGKPASEQVRVGATYAGLLVLACVMVFVLYLDFKRLFHL